MTLFKPRVGKVIFAQITGGLRVIIPNNKDLEVLDYKTLWHTKAIASHREYMSLFVFESMCDGL